MFDYRKNVLEDFIGRPITPKVIEELKELYFKDGFVVDVIRTDHVGQLKIVIVKDLNEST